MNRTEANHILLEIESRYKTHSFCFLYFLSLLFSIHWSELDSRNINYD